MKRNLIAVVVLIAISIALNVLPTPAVFAILAVAVLGFVAFIAVLVYFENLSSKCDQTLIDTNWERQKQWKNDGGIDPQIISQSVLQPLNNKGIVRGTAFLIEGDIVVTNRHVAQLIDGSTFLTKAGERVICGPLYMPSAEDCPDLAFYRVLKKPDYLRPLKLAEKDIWLGDKLLIVGHNSKRNLYHVAVVEVLNIAHSLGYVVPWNIYRSKLTRMLLRTKLWHLRRKGGMLDKGAALSAHNVTDGDTSNGNSGSPVVNLAGEVIGVHYAGEALGLYAYECYGMNVTLKDLKTHLAIAHEKLAA